MKWSKQYNFCQNCNTNEIKHEAKGLCKKCYRAEYRKTPNGKIAFAKAAAKSKTFEGKEAQARYNKSDKGKKRAKKYFKSSKGRKLSSKNSTRWITIHLKTDINYKIKHSLRNRLRVAVKNNWKSGSAVKDLGISIPEFKVYIETKFQPGMSWENYGRWEFDHITPLSYFDLTDREQFLQACHYTNYQPLWAIDNRKKSDKLDLAA